MNEKAYYTVWSATKGLASYNLDYLYDNDQMITRVVELIDYLTLEREGIIEEGTWLLMAKKDADIYYEKYYFNEVVVNLYPCPK